MLKIFDRYLIRETIVPLCLGLVVLTFILMIQPILKEAEVFIAKGVEWSVVARVLLTLLPAALSVTIPMAVLLGIPVSDVSVDLNAILLYQRHYCGSLGATGPDTDFPLFLEWVREGKFPLGKLVTNRYSLEQVEEARVALEEGQVLGRAIIEI